MIDWRENEQPLVFDSNDAVQGSAKPCFTGGGLMTLTRSMRLKTQ